MAKTLKKTIKDMVKGAESITRDSLGRFVTTTTHRGTDIDTSSGVHLHVGTTTPSAGTMAVYDGTDWFSMDGSKTPLINPVNAVKKWANEIATEDNDMIYLRKKNGILYVLKAEVHTSGTWSRLDPADEPVIIDIHGKTLEEKLGNPDAKIVDATTATEIVEEQRVIPDIQIGWHQDQQANLYYYEGEGHWREVDLKTNKKLTEAVVAGTLEFIG